MQRMLVLSLALSSVFGLTRSASAQITQQRGSVARSAPVAEPLVSEARGPDYDVTFDTDALDATLENGIVPRIVCRPVKGFGELTRPRTHFVPELLKSVELM